MKNKIKQLFFKKPKPDIILIIRRGTNVKVDRMGNAVIISTEERPLETICNQKYRAYFDD